MAEPAAARLRWAEAALAAALPLAGPADVALSTFFRAHRALGARDRSFIAETVFACLRRRRLLEHLAGGTHPRRLVLACLVKLRGAPVRELAPFLGPHEAAWLDNVGAASLADLPFALRCDLPDWLIERLLPRLGEAALLALARSLNEPAPLDLRVNRSKTTREAVLAQLAAEGIAARTTPYSPLGVRLAGHPAISRHELFRAGAIEVQDEGSQLVGLLVAPRRHALAVDFCAGAGGKTLLLGDLMQSQGRLYAFDTSPRRLAQLRPRLVRAGLTNVEPRRIAGENDARVLRLAGKVDRVLVDAPCSGLGTLRRNPDLKWRQTPAAIAEMAAKQASILAAAARLVRPGGRLVYGTCSVLAEENEDVVAAFLDTHPAFALVPAAGVLAQARVALDTGRYLALTPAAHGCDGFFGAVLERDAAAA